jgi:SAM-dependent methyltransferase
MAEEKHREFWERLGGEMPYYGVLTEDRFAGRTLEEAARDAFFQTGEVHVAGVLAWVRAYLVPDFAPATCLDFGCGVGRLAIAFARRIPHVVGVDASNAMLAEAAANAARLGVTNVVFTPGDERLDGITDRFDLVHTYVVLQHISPDRAELAFGRLVDLVGDTGVGVLHVSLGIDDETPLRRTWRHARSQMPWLSAIANVLKGRAAATPIFPMHELALNRLARMLRDRGCDRVVVQFTQHGRSFGALLLFTRRPKIAPDVLA